MVLQIATPFNKISPQFYFLLLQTNCKYIIDFEIEGKESILSGQFFNRKMESTDIMNEWMIN